MENINKKQCITYIILMLMIFSCIACSFNNKISMYPFPINESCDELILVKNFNETNSSELDILIKDRYNLKKLECETFYVGCHHIESQLDTTFLFLKDKKWEERNYESYFRKYHLSKGKLISVHIYRNGNYIYAIDF